MAKLKGYVDSDIPARMSDRIQDYLGDRVTWIAEALGAREDWDFRIFTFDDTLYVDFEDWAFVTPTDMIPSEQVTHIVGILEGFYVEELSEHDE
jgi:hypothetical protein